MLSICNLKVSYGNNEILSDFSLDMLDGEIYSLIGPSGCGKSTLLKVLCGIITNYSGELLLDGKPLDRKSIRIGYVPQQYGLLDWMKIRDNIFLSERINKGFKTEKRESQDIIQSLEIEDLQDRYPSQLSGGQKQRVALARAFVSKPDLLLMDEPFSSLDTFTSQASQQVFLRLWEKYKVTTLFITHNIHEAAAIGRHILMMSKLPGEIIDRVENQWFGADMKAEDRLKFVAEIIHKVGYQ